jgi:hypothetical protein
VRVTREDERDQRWIRHRQVVERDEDAACVRHVVGARDRDLDPEGAKREPDQGVPAPEDERVVPARVQPRV